MHITIIKKIKKLKKIYILTKLTDHFYCDKAGGAEAGGPATHEVRSNLQERPATDWKLWSKYGCKKWQADCLGYISNLAGISRHKGKTHLQSTSEASDQAAGILYPNV